MPNKAEETTPIPHPVILTVEQVATLLQIPPGSVYEKTRSRTNGTTPPLPCRRVGRYLRFVESEVMAWLLSLPHHRKRGGIS